MATAVKTDTLASAMAAAFAEIESVTKEAENPAFKRDGKALKYADLGAVIGTIKPPLINHGLFFTQHNQPSENGVTVETVLHHGASGEKLSLGSLFVPANKNDAQGFGSALTYARRYALMTAFGVPAEDDDGNAAAKSAANSNNGYDARAKAERDAPFPPGPAKNKTELKELIRPLWRDIEAAGDPDELDLVLKDKGNMALIAQLVRALPDWWEGRTSGTTPFEGLESLINRRQTELAAAAVDVG